MEDETVEPVEAGEPITTVEPTESVEPTEATAKTESTHAETDVPESGTGDGDNVPEEKPEGENVDGEHVVHEGEEHIGEEQIGEEHIGEERVGEEVGGEATEGEGAEGEETEENKPKRKRYSGEEIGELEGEELEEEEEKKEEPPKVEEVVEEEEVYVEEPPPDPAAPYDLSDSKEALKEPFSLRPDQLAEVEQLWELYQNYTPSYTDIDNYITEKELVYMMKCLLLLPFTPEQLQELIEYCVRPKDPKGHINYQQFLKMVTMRQRDFPIEDELRTALQVLDPDKTGTVDREFFKELLRDRGHKMPQKQLDNLIKEVDIAGDGTIGIEDVVGTMCIDLNKEDLILLMNTIFPPEIKPEAPDDD